VVDLDPTHRVLRITVTAALTDQAAKDIYQAVAPLASQGGPYATITDLSQVVDFPISADTIRTLAVTASPLPLASEREPLLQFRPEALAVCVKQEIVVEATSGPIRWIGGF
jgi:hypothetical protein